MSCLFIAKLLHAMFFIKLFCQIVPRKYATPVSYASTVDCLMILFATRTRGESQLAEAYRIQHVFPFP